MTEVKQFILVVFVRTENRNARRIGNIWFAGAAATVAIASGRRRNAELEMEWRSELEVGRK